MPQFYFHIRYATSLYIDEDGMKLPDLPAAVREAMLSALQITADAIRTGTGIVPKAFVITDSTGETLHTLPFITVLPESIPKREAEAAQSCHDLFVPPEITNK